MNLLLLVRGMDVLSQNSQGQYIFSPNKKNICFLIKILSVAYGNQHEALDGGSESPNLPLFSADLPAPNVYFPNLPVSNPILDPNLLSSTLFVAQSPISPTFLVQSPISQIPHCGPPTCLSEDYGVSRDKTLVSLW